MKLFGTDGIRGKANIYPMVPELVLQVGKAVCHYFKELNNNGNPKIVIGKDTRLSGYMLENALTSGIVSMGGTVLLVGPMPTPAIAFLTRSLKADAGIVLSASHNPAEDNGIKIFDRNGYKLNKDSEEKIEKIILEEKLKNFKGQEIGKAFRIDDAKDKYIEFAKNSINSNSLDGLKIVLDCANGAAYDVGPKIFSKLGVEVITINNKPNGKNINLECGATHPEEMQKKVVEEKANMGIALDGDADRIIVANEKGEIVDGDHLIAIAALELKKENKLDKNLIVTTVMANSGFHKLMEEQGIKVLKTPVGDKYVIEEMRKEKCVLGGEQSGHIIFSNYGTTGDGIITGLQILNIMKNSGKKLSELAKVMTSYPQILLNIPVRKKKPLEELESVQKAIKEVEEKLAGNGRTLVRYSGTQNLCRITIEAQTEQETKEYAEHIAKAIKKELG